MALAEFAELLEQAPATSRQRAAVLVRLRSGAASLQDLIEASALSRRGVEEILRALGEDAVADAEGRWALREGARAGAESALGPDPRFDAEPGLVEELRQARARSPKPNADLDHVAATAETVVARAVWIARRFGARSLRVLFVGDHDLTSLALAKLCPPDLAGGLQIAVVDVDEGLLAFLAGELRGTGASFRLRHADLRRGFPADLEGWADLFVTDPPYTPEGVALFCARGAQGLRDLATGRGLLAYGYGEEQPALGLAVQKAVLGLDCLIEEIVPDFNRYRGAQAIGSASDWHLLRFAPSAARKVARAVGGSPTRIYSHGRQSVESAAAAGRALWDVRRQEASALFRALLVEGGERLELLVDNNHPDLRDARSQSRLSGDVAGKWSLRFRTSTPDSASAIVQAVAVGGTSPRGLVLGRAHGKLKNVLREAMIVAGAGAAGSALTKNQARELVAGLLGSLPCWGADLGESLVGDLPRAALRSVLGALEGNALSEGAE